MKVYETWLLWDDQHEISEWKFIVPTYSVKQSASMYTLCVGKFNGERICDGPFIKSEDKWLLKYKLKTGPLFNTLKISYKKFIEFLDKL